MLYRAVKYGKIGYVLAIYIMENVDNQEKMNLLSDELNGLCPELVWDEEIRVIFITGSGKDFFSISTKKTLVGPDSKLIDFLVSR
jgi:hypothetical protein